MRTETGRTRDRFPYVLNIMTKPGIGPKPTKAELKRLYVKESRSVRNIAELLGCSKDMVYRALQEYGIERREHTQKRSRLSEFDLMTLKREIKAKGFNQVATELGVHNTTLRRYVEKMKSQR